MYTKYDRISTESYLDFNQLLEEYQGTHKSNRTFALKHEKLITKPSKLLLKWIDENIIHLSEPLASDNYHNYLIPLNMVLAFIFLLLGFFTGIGLLNYNGDSPVNIIYYFLFSIFLPLGSMFITTLSMMTRGSFLNFFSIFLPLHWIEKLFGFVPFSDHLKAINRRFPPLLKKWMFIERLQFLSLLFSIGLFVALILMVGVKDLAFAWSTTLNVTAEEFHHFLKLIATPWEWFFPSALPSVELVEMSQYFRLGERLNPHLVENASRLGEWWKFLAISTLFYAIFLRLLFFIVTHFFYKKALREEFFSIYGVRGLLKDFKTPYVSTKAPRVEEHLEIEEEENEQIKESVRRAYNNIIGWNFSKDEILLLNDNKEIQAINIDTVGGSHTFSDDQKVVEGASRTILLYVKSWEPPTMDFIDLLEMLIENKNIDEVQLYPVGTVGRYYESDKREIEVWKRKIHGLKSDKVWVIDDRR